MAFTYRLSRRLAQAHICLVTLLTLACADQAASNLASPSDDQNILSPDTTIYQPPLSYATAAAISVGCTNEPTGYTTFSNQPWNAVPPLPPALDQYGWRNSTAIQSRLNIVSDPNAPGSPSKLMEGTFAKNTRGGTAPFNLELQFGKSVKKVYVCVWHKLSTNFTNNGNAGTKFGFLLTPYWGGTTGLNHFFNLTNSLGINLQSLDKKLNRAMNSSWKTLNHLGTWHKFEWLVISNTKGLSDGVARIWVDGNQVLNVTNVKYFHSGQTPRFKGITWNPTYGGGTNPVPFNMFEWVDNFYVSGS